MITTTCPNCGSLFRLPDDFAGKQVRCEKCATVFPVPMALAVDAAPLEAPVPELPAPPAPPPVPDPPTASEPAAPKEPAAATTTPAPAPPSPVPSTPSTRWALAALVSFFLAIFGTGSLTAFWVAANLAPPPRPVGSQVFSKKDFHRAIRKDGGFRDGGFADRRKDAKDGLFFDKKVDPQWPMLTELHLEPGGIDSANLRLMHVQPENAGPFERQPPVRLVHVRLLGNHRYNFVVDARGFAPRLRIFAKGDERLVASHEEQGDTRVCFVSFQPDRDGDYIIQVTRTDGNGDHFDLRVGKVTRGEPERILLGKQSIRRAGKLDVRDPIDLGAPPLRGPFREYLVKLDDGVDYEFKVFSASFVSVLEIHDDFGRDTTAVADGRNMILLCVYRTPRAGDYLIRVTSENRGLGDFTLQATRKSDGKR